jgi:uncharacterized delta-60 repeat protein
MLSRKDRNTAFEVLEGRTMFAVATDLDLSFSGDGKLVTDLGGSDFARAVAVQSDGRIVVAGDTQVTVNGVKKTAFLAIRYNADGSLDDGGSKDTTKGDKFGTSGKFVRVMDQGGGGAEAVAIQKDGKIILGGNAIKSTTAGNQWYFLRLNKDGSLDTSFGSQGVQSTNYAPELHSRFKKMALSNSGDLYVVGSAGGNWHLRDLTPGGQFNAHFGSGGLQTVDFGGPEDEPTAITIDQYGKIVVAGNVPGQQSLAPSYIRSFGIARFFASGDPDQSFGDLGKKVQPNGLVFSDVGGVVVRPNGDIALSVHGLFQNKNGESTPVSGAYRFESNGTFIGAGTSGPKGSAYGIVNAPGDLLMWGGSASPDNVGSKFYAEGVGNAPQRFYQFGKGSEQNIALAMALAPDGKVVQVGYTTANGGYDIAVLRYVGSPTSRLATVSGNVFKDRDQDGYKDANYDTPWIGGRVFIDANNNGAFDKESERSVLTDANGNYAINLAAGTYNLRLVTPASYTQSFPLNGVQTLKVAATQKFANVDFGISSTAPAAPGIKGSVFFDFDGDGFRDLQGKVEPDLAGRTVFLDTNGNSKFDAGEPTSITDAGGNYSFKNLASGNYRVGSVAPAGWTHTDPSTGFFDVFVNAGQSVSRNFATTFTDPDDTIGEINASPGSQIGVGKTLNFTISNVTDVDMIRFTAKKGQKIGIDVDRASGSSLNSYLRIFDSNGNQIAFNDDAAAPGESKGSDSYLSYTFNTAGNYFIAVSNNQNKAYEPREGYGDNGVGTTGGYKLSLANLSTSSARMAGSSLFGDAHIGAGDDLSSMV